MGSDAKLVEKAFDFAQETTKQVLTLSTGVLALTITFLNEVATSASHSAQLFLQFGWVCFLLSVIAGIATLQSLTGNLERSSGTPSIYSGNIKFFAAAQLIMFLAGLVLTLIFGWKAI